MSTLDFLKDADDDQMGSDFLGIVTEPENRVDTYQAAVDRFTSRFERGEESLGGAPAVLLRKHSHSVARGEDWRLMAKLTARSHEEHVRDAIAAAIAMSGEGQHESAKQGPTRPEPMIGYSMYYRICWMFIGLVALVWGAVLGASVTGAGWIGPTTAVTGTIGVVGLMATLFVAGRRSARRS